MIIRGFRLVKHIYTRAVEVFVLSQLSYPLRLESQWIRSLGFVRTVASYAYENKVVIGHLRSS